MRRLRVPELMIVSVWITRGPSRALNWTRRRQNGAVGERIEARDTSVEKSFSERARERRAEKAVNVQECLKSSLRITHITSRCGSLVSLMSPLHSACIPSHCICIIHDMNHPRIEEVPVRREALIVEKFIKRWQPHAWCKARNTSRIIMRC